MTTRPTAPMISGPFRSLTPCVRTARFLAGALLALMLGHGAVAADSQVSAAGLNQIESLLAEKAARTPAQQKMDSQLVYLLEQTSNQVISSAVKNLQLDVNADKSGRVLVDIKGTVSEDLLNSINKWGGKVDSAYAKFNAIRARLPIGSLEAVAGRDDVRFVEPAAEMTTNTGSVLSEGDRTHRADTARTNFATKGGSGIKVGVLSDGVNSLAASKANGNLNADSTVIPGQASSGDEGTAMMEIVQDLVPNAKIYFATGNGGPANFANNILLLQAAGCTVIVDDLTYFNESPFQDQAISQAVNTVSAAGVMYFSSARNSGNLDYGNGFTVGTGGAGTSGTWEGDWVDGGAATIGSKAGSVLNFGGGVTANVVTSPGTPGIINSGSQGRVDMFWSDPNGASNNDYDLFVLDNAGTSVLRSSTNTQNGTQDPYESVSTLNATEKVVVVKTTAAAARFIHLDVGRMYLTKGTSGNVRGHNAAGAANAFSVAATDIHNSPNPQFFVGGATNPVEYFSSDGPRRIFYQPNGTAITPGNVSSTGGTLLLKPDFTAANGVITSVPGFSSFYGTSAAAPHAAAIAALIKSYNPALTAAQIRTLLTSTSLDIEAAGYDRDSGSGIIMALQAITASPAPDALTVTGTFLDVTGNPGGPFSPTSTVYTLKNNSGSPLNWSAAKTQSWVTLSATSGTLIAGASTTVTVSLTAAVNAFGLGTFSDTVTFTNTSSMVVQTRGVSVSVVPPPPANDNFANAIALSGISAHPAGVANTYATKETGEPNHAGDTGGHSLWWKWVAPGNNSVAVDTIGSGFDTLLGVYTGSSVNALVTIASNDDAPGMGVGTVSALTFTPVAGTTYYIAADGWQGATGTIVLNIVTTVKPINDFNADTKADIVWQNTTSGDRGFYLMNGTAFSSWVDLGVVPTVWRIAATADFNGDNKPDILWENTSTGDRGFYLMNGTTFSSWVDMGIVSTDWRIAAAGDFNGDGKADILWENTVTGARGIYLMNGTSFTSWVDLGTIATALRIAGAADFNNDGKTDIIWENTSTGKRVIWFMNGTTFTSSFNLVTISTDWHIAAVADFNGDGHPDILWENTVSGDRGFWLMNGTVETSWVDMGVVTTDWRIAN